MALCPWALPTPNPPVAFILDDVIIPVQLVPSSGSAGSPPADGSHRMTSPGSSLPLQSPSAGCRFARCRAESPHHHTRGHLQWIFPGLQSAGRATVRRKPSHSLPSDTDVAVKNPDSVPSCICLVGLFLCQQRIFKPQKDVTNGPLPLMLVQHPRKSACSGAPDPRQ